MAGLGPAIQPLVFRAESDARVKPAHGLKGVLEGAAVPFR
jgi:hypothetical protein